MCSDVVSAPDSSVAQAADGGAVQPAAETAIVVDGIGKCYQIYARPRDRLIEALVPRLQRALGLTPSRFFQEGWALRDASFRVARGETVGIIGRNGSGKSTLLQMVCGTLTPTRGSAQVSGRVAALLELGSGFNPEYTGRENVYMNGTILGMSAAEIDAKFDSIAAFAEIGDFIERPVKTYSSGMYVRLAFAVIAHADADILVIDEALSVGDVFFSQKCMRFLRDFQTHGTVLFVSHSAAAVVNLCDRAIWLDKGHMVMDGPAKAVCEAYHASTYGAEPTQAARGVAPAGAPATAGGASDVDDARLDASRIRVFAFDPGRAGFGDGRAVVRAVRCEGSDGRVLQQVEGGEVVRLVVEAEALEALDSVIVGFFVKDRLGQHLFGKNTWRDGAAPVPAPPGGKVRAAFEFRMPYLPGGAYTLDVAIADGSPDAHVQLVWLFDALALESISSTVSTGLVGIPFRSVTLGASA
jgi:lipopolysaccharide transport system ATP-binding protein